jgi:GDP/UDP-N,N'-diacetylbacillosamine 2-epimerase (hydrolysing)
MMLALCGAYMNIPVAHYGAGDRVVGNVDDMVRHSISRLAHLHLTTHEEARERLIRSGEQPWRVHNVGHSGIDRIRAAPVLAPDRLAEVLGVPAVDGPYVIVIQHPLSSEIDQAGAQMRETLEAVRALGLPAFVSYPNSDAGGQAMIEVIRSFEGTPGMHVFRNIPDTAFVNLLRGAGLLIGNSSMGLLEAPYLKLGVINVGNRQTARHHAANVFFVPHERQAILRQARLMLDDPATRAGIAQCANPFGDGRSGERVAALLATTPLDERLRNKDLTY